MAHLKRQNSHKYLKKQKRLSALCARLLPFFKINFVFLIIGKPFLNTCSANLTIRFKKWRN